MVAHIQWGAQQHGTFLPLSLIKQVTRDSYTVCSIHYPASACTLENADMAIGISMFTGQCRIIWNNRMWVILSG
eukprot:scaffold284382_cov75-Attheya_sp.AAC.3